ncbi:MAG: CarD family transcriptional regulator [Sphaerochaetaceae bacterium]|jgi:CarD family transcriptional regulator
MIDKETEQYRFARGQHVVYPRQGVGEVRDITEREFKGKPTMFYVIYFENSDMTVSVPIAKIDDLKIRGIVESDRASKALEAVGCHYDMPTLDWKARYQMNVDLVNDGTIESVAKVIHTLFKRSLVKELPVQERKLYDSAMNLLVDEVSYSLKLEKDEVKTRVMAILQGKDK